MIQSKDENPVNLERGYMIAYKIAECHDAAKKLFDDQFHEKTKPIRLALEALMEKSGCDAVEAGLHLLRFLKEKGDLNAIAIMMTCAVVYDIRSKDTLAEELESIRSVDNEEAPAANGAENKQSSIINNHSNKGKG